MSEKLECRVSYHWDKHGWICIWIFSCLVILQNRKDVRMGCQSLQAGDEFVFETLTFILSWYWPAFHVHWPRKRWKHGRSQPSCLSIYSGQCCKKSKTNHQSTSEFLTCLVCVYLWNDFGGNRRGNVVRFSFFLYNRLFHLCVASWHRVQIGKAIAIL